MKRFDGKIAVVTGAGGTLCSEIAIELSLEGALVYLVGRTEEKLAKTAEKIKEMGGVPAKIFACDVTDRESISALAEQVEAAGCCDFLINGAGGNNAKAMPTITKFDPRELTDQLPEGQKGLYDIDMDAFESVLKINTMGTIIPTMESVMVPRSITPFSISLPTPKRLPITRSTVASSMKQAKTKYKVSICKNSFQK